MRFSITQTRLGLRNSITRIAFRYGSTCLTRCPQAVLSAEIEANGRRQWGHAGDCLPPGWFDKSPGKDYRLQIEEMLETIGAAQTLYLDQFARPGELFDGWLAVDERIQQWAEPRAIPPLLATFGNSLVERAVMDAIARWAGASFHRAVHENLFGIRGEAVHPELKGLTAGDWLPAAPQQSVFVRHTVGLGDPILAEEIADLERLDDGFPQALEQYIERTGTCYFKIKLANDLERDIARLATIASVVEKHLGDRYRVTLDGNEQYRQGEQLDVLFERIQAAPELKTLFARTLAVEQPLERSIALDVAHTEGIRRLGKLKPVVIDESDGTLDAYRRALDVGYRGVTSKNCKGPIKSLLNAGLTWHLNRGRDESSACVMTGEDLCSVGIIPVQADLCLAATLGLEHVERNGHHYHPGLTYLPAAQRQAALAAHGDFYAEQQGVVSPQVVDGRFQIGSLQCPGFGFAVEPDWAAYTPGDEWRYESLGL